MCRNLFLSTVTDTRNIIIVLGHWMLHGFAIISIITRFFLYSIVLQIKSAKITLTPTIVTGRGRNAQPTTLSFSFLCEVIFLRCISLRRLEVNFLKIDKKKT